MTIREASAVGVEPLQLVDEGRLQFGLRLVAGAVGLLGLIESDDGALIGENNRFDSGSRGVHEGDGAACPYWKWTGGTYGDWENRDLDPTATVTAVSLHP